MPSTDTLAHRRSRREPLRVPQRPPSRSQRYAYIAVELVKAMPWWARAIPALTFVYWLGERI